MTANAFVLDFAEIDRTKLPMVGGKGANLGELSRIDGINVPEGFCVTTEAYRQTVQATPELPELLRQLAQVRAVDRERITEIGAQIRRVIEAVAIPAELAAAVTQRLAKWGDGAACAVRSSATAEDLPTASFAGQQDTYLNIIGSESILRQLRKCWASLFTERAITYRIQNGFDHRKVYLSVVIQRMRFPQAAGILFTADPITMNRKVTSIDASFGLGEALVSGLVTADNYKVRDGRLIGKRIATKALAVYARAEGGTEAKPIDATRQGTQTLTDEQALSLERIGRRIEAHFGCPQDVEWCLDGDSFFVVQSRPITTLYPVPTAADGKNHVYMSFSHQQMMTDAMKPLGISFFQVALRDKPEQRSNAALFVPIGGRLFFDLARDLSSPVGRKILLAAMGAMDPLVLDALGSLVNRKDFMKSLARKGKRLLSMGTSYFSWALVVQAIKISRDNNPAVLQPFVAQNEATIRAFREQIANLSGEDLFAAVIEDFKRLKEAAEDPKSMGAVYAGTLALNWINKHMQRWLGEKGAADSLTKSIANDVTSNMGLELLDVADVVRQYPAVVQYLRDAEDKTFFAGLSGLEGGDLASQAIRAYLEQYGMRGPGEIDITRPRFGEQPTALVPMILSSITNLEPNAHRALFERGLREASEQEASLLHRLAELPGGRQKARKTRKKISVLRNFIGHREYPKYLMMQHYWIIKQALLQEAVRLAEQGVIREPEDIYYLDFDELGEAIRTRSVDDGVIAKRKAEYEAFAKLTPPRLMTSEGEVLSGAYKIGKIPAGALPGIAVSAGTVEGRARVVLNMADAHMEDGDILVTAFTDPSWTPVFVSVRGLVTEVGGMMTHGAVVAREYGLPAVVGVENATRLIQDGQRIRVNGTEGYVEVL